MNQRDNVLLATVLLATTTMLAVAGEPGAVLAPPDSAFRNQSQNEVSQPVKLASDDFERAGDSHQACLGHTDGADCQPTCGCEEDPCDCAQQKKKAAAGAVGKSHKPVFYDNDFSYLEDPAYSDWWPGDALKRRRVGNLMTFDAGGQYRIRPHHERGHRGLGLTGNDDDFLLQRTRVFTNATVGQRFRAYAEFIDAESSYENFAPRGIEVNRGDMLNLFADVKLFDGSSGEAWGRVGRQELLYGAERTISPLDWSNTRRTFEGYKWFWKGEQWDIDAFYTRPVIPNATQFDSADYSQEFFGGYATYKADDNRKADFYYLRYNNGNQGFQLDTIGARLLGGHDNWLWEYEGAYQFGENSDGSNHSAGFWVAGFGRKLPCFAWSPELWVYYDWASGSDELGAGNGYNHLFPLSHKYMGFMDLFGRRNLETPNVLLTMSPTKKLKLLVWYYYLFLENANDSPYNVNMTAFNPANAPASSELGQEIDLIASYTINPRTNLLFGYSHFFAGKYYELTPGVPSSGDADFFYTQCTFNF